MTRLPVFTDINGVDVEVWVRGDYVDVLLAVVRPEVPQRPRHGQKGNLVKVGAAAHWASVSYKKVIPWLC